MYGPRKKGYWSRANGGDLARNYRSLQVGRRYRVVKEFRDFDRDIHPVGETWTFRGYSYLPHDSGLSLFVALHDADEWHIRMSDHPDDQGSIIASLDQYVVSAG